MTSIEIRGTAHPPPPKDGRRKCAADLNAAEIASTNISGRPLLNEHDHNAQVGTCLASWKGTDGSLRIAARVEDKEVAKQVKDGKLRGLSLGTDMVMDETGSILYRGQAELSVCAEGRRSGTWIDTINGKTVHAVSCASKRDRARTAAPNRTAAPHNYARRTHVCCSHAPKKHTVR
jgi:hypothetical protein